MPSECDDGPFGKGTGGQLTYRVHVPAGETQTLWVAAAGSDQGVAQARQEFARALRNPEADLAAKRAARNRLARFTRVSLPGNRLLQNAIDWGKQNLADLTQSATNLHIRWTNQGHQFPSPLGTVPRRAGSAPASRTTRGCSPPTASTRTSPRSRSASSRPSRTTCGHCGTSRTSSTTARASSSHETVSDGSVWFGHNSQTTTNPDGTTTTTNDFNTDETIKFPSAVALLWRWTGDNAFRDEMYDFAKRNLHFVQDHLTRLHGWPAGSGNVERTGMGPIKLDNAVYYIRGLLRPRRHGGVQGRHGDGGLGAAASPATCGASSTPTSGMRRPRQYTDSLNADGTHETPYQKHWIGEVPQEAELTNGDRAVPGVAPHGHGVTALAARENSCFSGDRPGSRGLFHTGCGGGADGKGDTEIFSLTTAIQAVGEGNYGRLGAGQQQRYTRRQRGDDDLRADHRQHSRRTAGRDAGDLPVARRDGMGGSGGRRRTSTAASPAARCSCRPGATTARHGRWSTSSSACGRSSTTAGSTSCRRCRRVSPACRGATSASAAARRTCSPRTPAGATRRPSASAGSRCASLRDRRDAAARLVAGARRGRRRAGGELPGPHHQPRRRGDGAGAGRRRPHRRRHRGLTVVRGRPSGRPRHAVLRLARDAAAAGAGLGRGPARRGDAEHAHRLQAEAELLAAVGRGDVEAGEVAHALEPVADRVAVREEPRGGAGDVAVGVEERLERLHEVGLVLLVVGDERRDASRA